MNKLVNLIKMMYFQIFVEEHVMERDPNLERHMMAKISIWQPHVGDSYYGEFYLDYDYSPGRVGEEGRRCRYVTDSFTLAEAICM